MAKHEANSPCILPYPAATFPWTMRSPVFVKIQAADIAIFAKDYLTSCETLHEAICTSICSLQRAYFYKLHCSSSFGPTLSWICMLFLRDSTMSPCAMKTMWQSKMTRSCMAVLFVIFDCHTHFMAAAWLCCEVGGLCLVMQPLTLQCA